jgi:hypothetical protein
MSRKGGQGKISPEVEKAIAELLKEVSKPGVELKEKLGILTLALKAEAIKAKMEGDKWGGGLDDDEPETT